MPFDRKILRDLRSQRGSADIELAIVMPLMLAVVAFQIVFAVAGWETLATAAGVPLVARSAGAEQGNTAAAIAFLPGPAQAVSVQRGASGCMRAVQAQLNHSVAMRVPLIDALTVPLRGGSYTRLWKFWAGPPADVCN